jgi:putative DNA primase/helicase
VSHLHVDVDPRTGEDFEQERERILAALLGYRPRPHVIVDSGGGFQGLWRLATSIQVEGNITQPEGCNRLLAAHLGGDACWNVDRILRVPYTINLPNAKKRACGRARALASVVHESEGTYPLDDFGPPLSPRFFELLASDATLRARWGGDTSGLNDTSRSGMDMSLVALLKWRAFSREEIGNILRHFPHGKAREEDSRYVDRMFERVDASFDDHLTDLGNARRLVKRHGRDLCFVAELAWLFWDGQRWQQDKTGEVIRRAKDTVRSIYAEAAASEDESHRTRLAGWAKTSESAPRIRAMIELAQSESEVAITVDRLDTGPMLFNTLTGTINLKTGELREHRREDLLTKLAPVAYHPRSQCPQWDAFLDRVFAGNRALVAFLQRLAGYCLTGLTVEQVVALFYGLGANGKTTSLETLRAVFGDYAITADFSTFAARSGDRPRNDVARLRGARLVTCVEAGHGEGLNEVLLKQVTGGDTITARFLYREAFEYRPTFKLIIAANHKPTVRGTDDAIWRRLRLVSFPVQIPQAERDRELPRKLLGELPGILAWAVRGCLEWQQGGLGVPPEVRAATEAYREEMDPLAGFLDARCTTEPTAAVLAKDLYDAYHTWATEAGEEVLSLTAFGRRLTERGLGSDKRGPAGTVRRLGLRLKGKPKDPESCGRFKTVSDISSVVGDTSREDSNSLPQPSRPSANERSQGYRTTAPTIGGADETIQLSGELTQLMK